MKKLPSKGATPDDAIRVAEDMVTFVNTAEQAEDFKEAMTADLGTILEQAKKETQEATAVLPQEAVCRDNYSEACIGANTLLIRGLGIVRSAFGRTSPEYKQFIARAAAEEEEEPEETETAEVTG